MLNQNEPKPNSRLGEGADDGSRLIRTFDRKAGLGSGFGVIARLVAVCGMLLVLPGCNLLGWTTGIFRPHGPVTVQVPAQYTGLTDKRVAVLVSADEFTFYRFPGATTKVCEAISQGIATNVPGTTLTLPREVADYTKDNPYWTTNRPSFLIEQLGVDRLILVDLNEYRTNEPGNENIWRGVIDASFAVYEAEIEDPDNRTFQAQVRAEFPEESRLGLVSANASEATVEAAVLQIFALKGAGLFYDHEEVRH